MLYPYGLTPADLSTRTGHRRALIISMARFNDGPSFSPRTQSDLLPAGEPGESEETVNDGDDEPRVSGGDPAGSA
jgi:hypothetical protein